MNNPIADPQTARLAAGGVRARVTVTPVGLLAIGGLVAAILLSVPPIIRDAGAAGSR